MPSIFVSYRRADSHVYIGRIVDRLEAAGFVVFYDVDKIHAGSKWREAIRTSVSRSEVLVAVIGSNWLSERLHEEDDPVLTEISLALDLGKPVVPILLDRCPIPDEKALPNGLHRMRNFNAAHLTTSDPSFSDDMGRLIRSLRALTDSGLEPGQSSIDWKHSRIFSISRSDMRYGLNLGWQLGRYEIIRNSVIPEVCEARPMIQQAIVDALKTDQIEDLMSWVDYRRDLEALLKHYAEASLDRHTAILIGIASQRLALVSASTGDAEKEEMINCAYSALAEIDPLYMRTNAKKDFFDVLRESKPKAIVQILEILDSLVQS